MDLPVQHNFTQLRIHDLVAKVAHVRLKDSLRVLLALKAVAEEYDLAAEEILTLSYSPEKPTPMQARHCQIGYSWMYENPEIAKILCAIEQLN